MGTFALNDAKIVLGGYDLSGYHNSLTVDYGIEPLDDTVFGTSGTRSFKPGLKTVGFEGNIFWDSLVDGAVFDRIQAAREVMTFAASGIAEGDVVYSTRMVNAVYNPGGEIGALLAGTFSGSSANTPLTRSRLAARGSKAASGNGVGFNLGATLITQRLYAALHVFSVGTNIIVTLESDDNSGFTTPTTRFTFSTATVIGAEWMELAGPITDNWWRATWAPTGGAAQIYVTIGIL